jgi:hypothetical protein
MRVLNVTIIHPRLTNSRTAPGRADLIRRLTAYHPNVRRAPALSAFVTVGYFK